ncbi:MAG: hypothetical protein MASP_00537 [Candidatus Methanolliviera sp. GoM_asphalt]|nr:MAG: hypothetical protein MASP_00537 [Candidatus Methanolliviera sp. GoM_asphalt]
MCIIRPYIASGVASVLAYCINGGWFDRVMTIIEMFIGG